MPLSLAAQPSRSPPIPAVAALAQAVVLVADSALEAAADVIYNPLRTNLVLAARERGGSYAGLEILPEAPETCYLKCGIYQVFPMNQ